MIRARDITATSHSGRLALSLVEVTISVTIVAVMMVSALSTLWSVVRSRQINQDLQIGQKLAEQLMAEILSKPYEDPDVAPGSFGATGSELAAGDRSRFDDVDDYDGWSASPPEMADGTVIPDRGGWERSVGVVYVSPLALHWVVGVDMGVKRITVTVSRSGEEVTSLVAISGRTREMP